MIDLRPDHLEAVKRILAELAPECEVRAFGSRVKWTAKDYSDLDLVIVGQDKLERAHLDRIQEAFEESDLPFRVDVLDWCAISTEFKEIIEQAYIVIQEKPAGRGVAGEWSLAPFEDIISVPLRNGLTRPRSVRGSGIKMVNMGELFAHSRIGDIDMERVSLSDDESSRYLLEKGDLLFAWQSLVLSGAGECSIFLGATEPVTFEGHLIRARIDRRKAQPEFYYYFFNSPGGRQAVESIVEQVAAAGIRGSDLARLQVPKPPLPEQRAIAAILGTLDDKIELNRCTNETLEAITRALFKSWFVDFDPVRAKAEGRAPGLQPDLAALFPDGFEESELGEIPAAWRVMKLSDLCTTQYGYTASATSEPVGPKFLRVTDINKQNWIEWSSVPHCEINEEAKKDYALKLGDLVVARMADPGKSAIIDEDTDAVFASYLVRLKTQSLAHSYYIYGFLKSPLYAEYSEGVKSGSVQANMNARVIVGASLVVPSEPLLEHYLKVVLSLRQRIVANVRASRTLAAIRDVLLPRLISGQLRVPEAETFVAERMP